MPTFNITSPDGTKYRVTGPEGSTAAEALERVKAQHPAAPEGRSLVGNALKPLADIPGDIGAEFSAGREMARSGIQEGGVTGVLKAIGGGVMEAFSPITGATKALVGDPIRANLPKGRAGELVAEGAEDVASMFGPGVVAKGARSLGKALPGVSKEAGALMSEGVELTPGQITGGIPRRAEEAFKSFPILGSFIRKAEGRSIESFNRAVINQSLAPISRKLPEDTAIGHDAIGYADRQFDDAYNRLKARITFQTDQQFITDLRDIRQTVNELPPELQSQWESIVTNRLARRMDPSTATMTGENFKLAESDLGRLASQYRSSSDTSQRLLAHALDETKLAIRSALARTNPAEADTLKAINEGYAMLVRAEGAAARRATSMGVFTPSDLLQTIKTADSSVRKRDFARGDALMQEFSEAAHKVLGNKLPDSGTFERAAFDVGAIGSGVLAPQVPIGLLGASLPYTAPATRALNTAVKAGPRIANRGLNALEQTGPLSVLSQQAGSYGALAGQGQQ